MPTYELLGVSTEDHQVRYRRYTRSLRAKLAFARLPKLRFTDSGHGVVFAAKEHVGRKLPEVTIVEAYVKEQLAKARDDVRAANRSVDYTELVGSETRYLGGRVPVKDTGWRD